MDDDIDESSILDAAKNAAIKPLRYAVSKPAQRFYISTLLLVYTSSILAALAVIGYILLYQAYIPVRGISRVVHLQFDPSNQSHPHGTAAISSALTAGQQYDIRVLLHMPRTPTNVETGNFMLDLALLGGGSGEDVILRERRPAILTYYSPMVDYVLKTAAIPWYLLGWKYEAEKLDVRMVDGVQFTKGWKNIPTSVRLEIQSFHTLQIYAAKVLITARLQGLRYFMYNYRVTSFVTFSICFWFVEMTFVLLSWLYLDYGLSKFGAAQQVPSNPLPKRETSEESQTIKDEDSSSPAFDELSDTSRTFPTFSRQPPLRYSASRIKKERDTEVDTLQNIPPAVEADDEDEAADYVLEDGVGRGMRSDSGLGTSMESSLDASRARRRSHKRESPPEC